MPLVPLGLDVHDLVETVLREKSPTRQVEHTDRIPVLEQSSVRSQTISAIPADDALFPSYDNPTTEQMRYCFSLREEPPHVAAPEVRRNLCLGYWTSAKFHDAFIERWFGSAAYVSADEYRAMCQGKAACVKHATVIGVWRDTRRASLPDIPPPSPFAKNLARNDPLTFDEAFATCLAAADRIGSREGIEVLGRRYLCDSVAASAVEIHKAIRQRKPTPLSRQ